MGANDGFVPEPEAPVVVDPSDLPVEVDAGVATESDGQAADDSILDGGAQEVTDAGAPTSDAGLVLRQVLGDAGEEADGTSASADSDAGEPLSTGVADAGSEVATPEVTDGGLSDAMNDAPLDRADGGAADAGATLGKCPALMPVLGAPCTVAEVACVYGEGQDTLRSRQISCVCGVWYEAVAR